MEFHGISCIVLGFIKIEQIKPSISSISMPLLKSIRKQQNQLFKFAIPLQQLGSQRPYQSQTNSPLMISQQKPDKIIFGSFPFRGPMQAVRLLCEYIGVDYENQFFNPIEWEKYKEKEAKDWLYQKIPFMKCGNFVITNSLAAAEYIVEKFNRTDLFGTTQQQRIIVNSSVSFQSIIMGALSLECDMKKTKLSQEQKSAKRQAYWKEQFYPKFKKAQEICKSPWFFDHITMIDFFLYEDYMLFSKIYPGIKDFAKLREVYENIGNLPAIKAYENGPKVIKDICPNKYFQNFAEEYKKSNQCKSESSSKSSCFSLCSEKKAKAGTGFCAYQKKEESSMDLE